MREISASSGVSQGGIYAHFSSKEEIYAELLEKDMPIKTFIQIIVDLLPGCSNPDCLFQKASLRFLAEFDITDFSLQLIDFVEFNGKYSKQNIEYINLLRDSDSLNKINQKFDEFVKNRMIKNNECHLFIKTFFSMLISQFIFAYFIGNNQIKEQDILDITNIFLNGIKEQRS